MKAPCLCIIVCIHMLVCAQNFPCTDRSFDGSAICNTSCFTSTTKTFGTVYSSFDFPNEGSTTINLKMDIYSPPKSNKTRPFILLLHAGGFRIGCRSSAAKLCKEFAKRGFVAATIDYRLGWVPALNPGTKCGAGTDKGDANGDPADEVCVKNKVTCRACGFATRKDQVKAAYRAVQDAHAALRYMVHFVNSPNAAGVLNEFNIDINNIYVGGQSAGAAVALSLAYMQQEDYDDDSPDYQKDLGKLNASGNSYTDAFKIKGIFVNWGGILNTKYIQDKPEDRVPMIAFHGQCDKVFPYVCGSYSGCKTLVTTYGSKSVYNKLTSFYTPVSVALYSAQIASHGILLCNEGLTQRVTCAVNFFNALNSNPAQPINILNEKVAATCKESSCTVPSQCSGSLTQSVSSNIISNEIPTGSELKNVSVFPNPTSGPVSYSYSTTKSSNVTVQVINSMSQVMYSKKVFRQSGAYSEKLPVNLQPGIYVVIIKIDKNVSVSKIICQ